MSWEKGRDVIEDLLDRGHLERVLADEAEARHLMSKARAHLRTAVAVADDDPEIAYDALYAAARKALTALLIQQGLRPTRAGGHEVTIEAAGAQLIPPLGDVLRPFRRLKRRRGQGDYAGSEDQIHPDDIHADLPAATTIVDSADRVLPQLTVFVPRR
ncbi:MAG TPA: hypothetical protein VFP72_12910 [Kineosporiaceae bacterium]|nr:hypothetical protein [Kineosporiaceae bacterium]